MSFLYTLVKVYRRSFVTKFLTLSTPIISLKLKFSFNYQHLHQFHLATHLTHILSRNDSIILIPDVLLLVVNPELLTNRS